MRRPILPARSSHLQARGAWRPAAGSVLAVTSLGRRFDSWPVPSLPYVACAVNRRAKFFNHRSLPRTRRDSRVCATGDVEAYLYYASDKSKVSEILFFAPPLLSIRLVAIWPVNPPLGSNFQPIPGLAVRWGDRFRLQTLYQHFEPRPRWFSDSYFSARISPSLGRPAEWIWDSRRQRRRRGRCGFEVGQDQQRGERCHRNASVA
mgnify:CR=1 FL=1